MAEAITRLVNPAEEQRLDRSSYHVSISLRKASRLIRSLWKNILRGSIIGTLIGIIPGAGGSTATFMAYADARRSSKNKEQFGKGCLEGIAAPEAANNASSGGAMVPLLTLGIPGSLTTAVMMGLFVAHGLQPGPLFFISNPDVVYSVYIALFVSNLLLIPAGVYGANLFARFLRIPSSLIYPIIFGISITGAFALRNSFVDIWAAVLFAMLGFFLNAFRWPIAPLVIGMVLGPLIETSFRGSMVIFNGDAWRFFTRPISAVFLGVAFLFLLWSLLRFVIQRLRGAGQLEKK
jgi:putative tricarboxylic transport membrane protein